MPDRALALTKAVLMPVCLALITCLQPRFAWAEGADDLITKFCLASFNAAMTSAGKSPPAGMGAFTCKCFLNEVKQGGSIEASQTTCKEQAASRYKL